VTGEVVTVEQDVLGHGSDDIAGGEVLPLVLGLESADVFRTRSSCMRSPLNSFAR
jgi:hypothetical protein